jgi:hypothetical protein
MKVVSVLGRLSAEDLARLRLAECDWEVFKAMPTAYGKDAARDTLIRFYQLREEFASTYSLPEHAQWTIQLTNGVIIEDE